MGTHTLALVACDLGAENGRVTLGRFDGERLSVEPVHRFANEPVWLTGHLHWDLLRLLHEIGRGIAAARRQNGAPLSAVAVDTWGVDVVFFSRSGEVLGNPLHYRDPFTEGVMQRAFSTVPARAIFEKTGIQMMPINTLYQLIALKEAGSALLQAADRLLMLPSALTYLLSGEMQDEFTAASTSQIYDPRARGWSDELIERFELPRRLFAPVAQPGSVVGPMPAGMAAAIGIEPVPIVLGPGHDTACAVAAVPAAARATTGTWAYISSGTWSLVGVEVTAPVITGDAFAANVSNEGGVLGTYRLLRNVMGLWLLQQCRRQWAGGDGGPTYAELEQLARQTPAGRSFVDPDHPGFLRPGDTVGLIQESCRATGQPIPEGRAEITRTILDSLALKYRWVVERLERVAGLRIDRIHVVGGGSQNELLCQLTADATGRPVVAGPVEATTAGSLLMQAKALGEIGSLEELRTVVRRSFSTRAYEPRPSGDWDAWYGRMCELVGKAG